MADTRKNETTTARPGAAPLRRRARSAPERGGAGGRSGAAGDPGAAPDTPDDGGDGEDTSLLKTKTVLEATGLTHQMLYRYVTLGLVEEAGETRGGQRLFHPRVIPLISHIRGLNETGYSLRDLKDIFCKDSRVERACGRAEPDAGEAGDADPGDPEASARR